MPQQSGNTTQIQFLEAQVQYDITALLTPTEGVEALALALDQAL